FTTLDDPLANSGTAKGTEARGINNAGLIVGDYTDASGLHGFLFTGGSNFITLDDPLGVRGTQAFGINDAGQIVGLFRDASTTAPGSLLAGATSFPLNDPLAIPSVTGTIARGINAPGQIGGSYNDGASGHPAHGFSMVTGPNPPPPAGTSADMILRHGADGL